MVKPVLLLAVFLQLYCSTRASNADVDKWPSVEEDHTRLQVVVPASLQKKGGYQHKDALFGYPSYGVGSLHAQLIYANSTACSTLNSDNWDPPFALLIDRGGCHFVEKVRRAQHAGARAVIIADNKCLCTDSECMSISKDLVCERDLPYMADDESGGDISIPSMMIRKSDAMKIKETLAKGEGLSNVMVNFGWGIPSPDGRVEWTLWHSAWDEQSLAALKEIEWVSRSLGKRSYFTPRFVSYNGSKVGCHGGDSSLNPCGNMCLNSGRYCLLDPSPYHDQGIGASGSDVVLENLRRKCIWKLTSKEDEGVGVQWWEYVNDFGNECSKSEEKFKDSSCAKLVMKKHGIDIDEVEKCMQPYGPDVDKVNQHLEEELKEQTSLQLLRLPALYVDGVHARGRINGASAFGMICAGFGSHDPPQVCECVQQSPVTTMNCIKQGGLTALSEHTSSVGFGTIMFILIVVALSVAAAGYVYWRRTQRHMREQVRSILAEYMPLEDQSLMDNMSPRMHPAAEASAKSPRGFLPTNDLDDEDGV